MSLAAWALMIVKQPHYVVLIASVAAIRMFFRYFVVVAYTVALLVIVVASMARGLSPQLLSPICTLLNC